MGFKKFLHILAAFLLLAGAILLHFTVQYWVPLQRSWTALWYVLPILALLLATLFTTPRAISGGTRFSKGLFGFVLLWGGAAYFSQITLLLSGGCTSEVCIFVTAIQQMMAPYLLIVGSIGMLLTSWRIWSHTATPTNKPSNRGFVVTCSIAILIFYILPVVGTMWSVSTPVFTVTPSSGTAPLTVSVVTNGNKDPGGDEYMDYGDGTPRDPARGAADPNETHAFSHTFTKPGTYIITFYAKYIVTPGDPSIGNLRTDTDSGFLKESQPLGSQTVVVH